MNGTAVEDRRAFLGKIGSLSLGAFALPVLERKASAQVQTLRAGLTSSPRELARDETFWSPIQRSYVQSPHFINLESGYYSPAPQPVLDARCANIRRINATPSFYMRRHQKEDREAVRRQLANLAGCSPEEVVITRNTTESLNTVIHGLELGPEDEVLFSDREYPNMIQALEQRSRRYGLKCNSVTVPFLPKDPKEVVHAYREALTPKTRVILVSHMIFKTGQVLPIREICDMAHERGIEVIVDAAHSFAHVDFKISDLGCDYLGCSLHKWLAAPLGTGLLYVKKDKIPKVWPLFGDTKAKPDDIRKLERIGTQPVSRILTLANAIRFHEALGGKVKEERLRYLKDTWAKGVANVPGITLNTPLDPAQSCALANVSIASLPPKEVARRLYDDFRIFTVAVDCGVRVAPNLHTTMGDLEIFVKALESIARA